MSTFNDLSGTPVTGPSSASGTHVTSNGKSGEMVGGYFVPTK